MLFPDGRSSETLHDTNATVFQLLGGELSAVDPWTRVDFSWMHDASAISKDAVGYAGAVKDHRTPGRASIRHHLVSSLVLRPWELSERDLSRLAVPSRRLYRASRDRPLAGLIERHRGPQWGWWRPSGRRRCPRTGRST